MRGHAQDALLDLFVKTVHHRQHDDQRNDAEHDPEHRDQRDERDEMITPFRPRVAQTDEQ
jgi:hypothetical protein